MAEYIERKAAVKAAQDGADEWDGGYNRNRDMYIEAAIDEVPAADVKPVIHGHWIVDRECGNDVMSGEQMVICSVCGKGFFYGKTHYCPNCGAQMDKEPTDI